MYENKKLSMIDKQIVEIFWVDLSVIIYQKIVKFKYLWKNFLKIYLKYFKYCFFNFIF